MTKPERPAPADGAAETGCADQSAIERWFALAEIAHKEPSLPVWRPRTKRERAQYARVDARWRALLARARTPPGGSRGTTAGEGSGWS